MNAKSLSPRISSKKKSQIVLKKLITLNNLSPNISTKPNDSTSTINYADSQISFTNSQINPQLSSSKLSLKLSSPYSQPSLNYSASAKLKEISKRFSKSKVMSPSHKKAPGEHLLPLPIEKVMVTFENVLSKYELSELLDYREVYYLGLKAKKTQPNIKLKNMGFDDNNTDYIIIKNDHIAYQFEIIEILGSGSFAQVCHIRIIIYIIYILYIY